jgi:hypothetical protein
MWFICWLNHGGAIFCRYVEDFDANHAFLIPYSFFFSLFLNVIVPFAFAVDP